METTRIAWRGRSERPPVLRKNEARRDEVADGPDGLAGEGLPRVLLFLPHQRHGADPGNLGCPARCDDVRGIVLRHREPDLRDGGGGGEVFGRRRGRSEGHADEVEGPRETVPPPRLPRPSDHPIRGLSRDHGPATGPPSGPRQTGDDPRRPHGPRVRRGRGARVDAGPGPRAIDPRSRATLRRNLSDRDGRGLAAHPERMARDQGPPDDVWRATRAGTAANPPGGPADHRRRREGPAGSL